MDSSGTSTWGHFYSSGHGTPREPSSTFAEDIPVSPNDELFQDVNTAVEQRWRNTDDIGATRQASSTSHAVLHSYGAMPFISQPTQGSSYTSPQTMLNLQAIHPQSDMMILIQHPYQSGLPLDHLRAVPPMYYGGFNLQNAFVEDFSGLQASDQLAWTDDIRLPPKLAIVFWFPGYPMYKHQVTVLRAHSQPPTRGTLARIVAREMKRYLDKARTEYRRPLCWHGWELSLSDLLLIDIEQVSRGSLQPRIGTRGNMRRLPSELVQRMNMFSPLPSIAY